MKASPVFVLLALAGLCPLSQAGNLSPAARYAYDANAGWIDFSPTPATAVTVGDHFLSGYAYAANYGWIHFGNGAPTNGYAYSNVGADRGVNLDPASGRFNGWAYAANIGWLGFGWAGANDPNAPRVNPTTGIFAGWAYSENSGWIRLSQLAATTLAVVDSDGDGISDAWEKERFGNLTAAGIGTDWDKDGQSDAAEFAANTEPKNNASWLKITTYAVNGGRTQSTVTFTSTPTRLYRLQTSTNLVLWSPVTALGEFPGAAAATSTTVTYAHSSGPALFHRVIARPY